MNIVEREIIKQLYIRSYSTQRDLAAYCNCSLGMINRCLQHLKQTGYLDEKNGLTELSFKIIEKNCPRRAVILAAAIGMRMVPVNVEYPKGLLEVKGDILIERLIKQLHEVNITEIYVVVGFMKEQFEYLIDKYGVELIVNAQYATKNNLYSISLVKNKLKNAYIMPCDIWCQDNPFSRAESYSWYLVEDSQSLCSDVKINRKYELEHVEIGEIGNPMIGICYLNKEDASKVEKNIEELSKGVLFNRLFWEESLYKNKKMIVSGKLIPKNEVYEINSYGQLKNLTVGDQNQLDELYSIITKYFHVDQSEIQDFHLIKKGMTNCSYIFTLKDGKYLLRIPNSDSGEIINRKQEKDIYKVLQSENFSDQILYIDENTGYKISVYIENARTCNSQNEADVRKCIQLLKRIHKKAIQVPYKFDIYNQINFYETLWKSGKSAYPDYEETKEHVYSLKEYINKQKKQYSLTHLEVTPDNFLLYLDAEKNQEVTLIDWEYASMQDPDMDLAMFVISAGYNKKQVDDLINFYFENSCSENLRKKIYCYIATCGLLWSNWCEFKQNNGEEFGEFSLRQYRYAKVYYRYAVGIENKYTENVER